jgi:hypothetical protein
MAVSYALKIVMKSTTGLGMGAGNISNTYLGSLSKMTIYRTNSKCWRVAQAAKARTALATILPISPQPLKLNRG